MIRRILQKFTGSVCVAGIIVKDNRIYLEKRCKIIPEGGKWALLGGHVDYGEKAVEAIKREIKEETGFNVKNTKFLFYFDEIIPRLKLHNMLLVFRVNVSGKEKLNWESSESGWFSRKEVEKMDIGFKHKEVLNRFFNMKKR